MSRALRTPGRPEDSFDDDPLRMLRAARFAAQLGFGVEPVLDAMTSMAERMGIVSAERVRDEFSKLVLSANPRAGLRILVETRLADQIVPELPALQLEIDEHHRHKDVYEHTLTVLDQAIDLEADGPDLMLRLAALLHDIGKPRPDASSPAAASSFHHHEIVGARMARKRLKALRYPNGSSRTSRGSWGCTCVSMGTRRGMDRLSGASLRAGRWAVAADGCTH